jgi:hypothetical protein
MEVKKFKLKALKSFLDQNGAKINQGKEFDVDFLDPFLCSKIRVGDVLNMNETVAKTKEFKNGE